MNILHKIYYLFTNFLFLHSIFYKTLFSIIYVNKLTKLRNLQSLIYIYDKNGYLTLKKKYLYIDEFHREYLILKKLEKYNHFPKIIEKNKKEKFIIINYVGIVLNKHNKPKNWLYQINKIINILKKNKIYHNDIKCDHFLVKNNIISLIDFGRASFYYPLVPDFFNVNNFNKIITSLDK